MKSRDNPLNGAWPLWQRVRAEEVRTLPLNELGPWARKGGTCVKGLPSETHPVEQPHFFHCRKHMAQERAFHPSPPRHKDRDLGLCVRCKGPAEPDRRWGRTPGLACALAEKHGTTVARMSTRKFCADCDPYSKPWCMARACPNKRKRHRSAGGCSSPVRHRHPHCAAACTKMKKRDRLTKLSQQAKHPGTDEVPLPPVQCARRKCPFCGEGPRAPAVDCWHNRQTRKDRSPKYKPHCQQACDADRKRDAKAKAKRQKAARAAERAAAAEGGP